MASKPRSTTRKTRVGSLAPEAQAADVAYVDPQVARAQEGEAVTFSLTINDEE